MRAASRRLAMVLAALLLAGGCARHRRPAARGHDVIFWHSLPAPVVTAQVRAFEAANPDVHVTVVPMPDATIADSARAAVTTGSPPDLCQLHGDDLPPFLAQNSLSDWSAGVADLRPALRGWEMSMLGDAIYGLPWLLSTQVLAFDRAVFARAHLDSTHAPASWSELRSAAARIERWGGHQPGGVHGFGLAVGAPPSALARFMPWAWSGGGEILSAALDSSRFDSPANLRALEFLASLRTVSRVATADTLAREFAAGRVAMIVADSRQVAGRSLAPFPGPASPGTTLGTGEVLVSFTASRRKEDALRLARFLVQPGNARALAAAVAGSVPSARDTTIAAAADPLARARFLPNVRNRTALEDTLATLLDEAILGRRRAAEAIATADSFITTHLGVK